MRMREYLILAPGFLFLGGAITYVICDKRRQSEAQEWKGARKPCPSCGGFHEPVYNMEDEARVGHYIEPAALNSYLHSKYDHHEPEPPKKDETKQAEEKK